ncbi:MAG: hypothetical protein Q3966_00345 [Neisseria sp.]|nr:hypothetical protein [Neisseria sp.]
MNCPRCTDLAPRIRIDSPKKLAEMMRRADRACSQGILADVGDALDDDWSISLTECRQPDSPYGYTWPDIVSLYFACTHCGQMFHLNAETYHGGGGCWEQIPRKT